MKQTTDRVTALVTALCRRHVDEAVLETAAVQLAEREFRAAFLERAARLRVSGLVLHRLCGSPSFEQGVPRRCARELRGPLGRLRRASDALDLERVRLVAALRCHGLDPLLLKGAALRATLYADEPVRRHGGDIDILVPEAVLDEAIWAAGAAGYIRPSGEVWEAYRRHHFHIRLHHPLGYLLEVHWALSEPHLFFRLDPEPFLRDSILVERPGEPVIRVPSAAHMVLHLVAQNLDERFRCFSRLVDIDRILASDPHVDWVTLERDARSAKLDTALALTLGLCRRLLGTDVPNGRDRVRSAVVAFHLGLLEPEVRMTTPERASRSADDVLLRLWLIPGAWPRAREALRLASADRFLDPLHRALGSQPERGAGYRLLALLKTGVYQLLRYGSWVQRIRSEARE